VKLHLVVDHVSVFRAPLPGIGRLSSLASERCQSEIANAQYVDSGGNERWEDVDVLELVHDVKEELADAFAYLCAIAWRTHDTRWIGTFGQLGLLFEQIERLAGEDTPVDNAHP
jgi:hypothetical protein